MDCSQISAETLKTPNPSLKVNWETVSVIIPVYNNADGLRETLTTLQKQDYPKEYLEIIVVDNNSTDGSDQVTLDFPNVTLIYERETQSAGAARNKGLSVAKGSIIAFTDADCIPAKDWIKQGINALQKSNVDRVAGQILFVSITPKSSSASLLDTIYNFNQDFVAKTYGAAATANLFINRSVFEKVESFNPEHLLEDIEFGRRASAAGFNITFAPDSIVYHPPRNTVQAMWKKGKRCGRGIFSICQSEKLGGWMGWKHPMRVMRLLLLPRRLYWERLPFSSSQISCKKRLQIYLLQWITINLAEAVGYTQWFFRHLNQETINRTRS